jgi:NIPSNAP protein
MTRQLRDYTIQPGQLDRFVELWSAGVRPLRERAGFTIEGAWKVPAEDRFVWILAYDGPDGWEAANKTYYGSAGRKALDPDPAKLIASQRTAFIEPV